MAAVNGVMDHNGDSLVSSAHLGKRKRSTSPEKKLDVDGEDVSALQRSLRRKLQVLSSPCSSLLKRPLPSEDAHPPETKRARLSATPIEADTIEKRICTDFYTSIEQVRQDIGRLRDALSTERTEAQANGDGLDPSNPSRPLYEAAAKLADTLLADDTETTVKDHKADRTEPLQRTGQVITLRSQTEKGTQQLYSGLQLQDDQTQTIHHVDGRRLPNGFDLTDPATMDTSVLAPTKDRRLFGDVFRPHRSIKQLEIPRTPARSNFQSNVLGFAPEPTVERATTLNRQDYKFQQLPVSSWLNYNINDQQSARKLRGKSLGASDLRAALLANDVAAQDTDDASALFRKVFSSFAPITDTSRAVVSEQDRDRQWWSKYGSRRLRKIFQSEASESALEDAMDGSQSSTEDFADVVSSFQAEESEQSMTTKDDPESVDDVLSEISELLETLHSHQHIRSLDTRLTVGATKPTSAEVDSYELLRSQLAILISTLPPFAVAKLDGDKLEDLNISTKILVDTVDYRGTSQPDEYTLSRYRAAQGATATVARPPATASSRPAYPTPAMPRYNTSNNLSAYAQNLGIAAARYNQSANYQTPSNIQRQYQQTPLQQTGGTYSSQPTVQQFQRPAQNGYGSYTASPAQSGAAQTPTQPSYQQHAQNKIALNAAAARSVSPAKPMVNGQTPYYGQGSYQRPQQQPYSPSAGGGGKGGLVNGTSSVGS